MARQRGTSTQRGLGAKHQADKKRLLARLQDGEPCWRCGQPMYHSQALDRDHIVDRALGGTDGPAVLSHASCNRSAGGRLGRQLYPVPLAAFTAPPATCHTCGKTYTRKAQSCEICGAHFHPSYGAPGEQRTCGRACGKELQWRNKRATGWLPKAERPKPPRKERADRKNWPSSRIQVYTCRYCGRTCVAKATPQPREVCPSYGCQARRLNENRERNDGRPQREVRSSRAW